MKNLPEIFENNQIWAAAQLAEDPTYFATLAAAQTPKVLWIGCADSRVPASHICGLRPGELFVHRNIANLVVHTDMNCLSVIQYAVEALSVDHIIVCGHYGCGGVQAAMGTQRYGLIDNWLRNIKDVYAAHHDSLDELDDDAKFKRLCELNVAQQVANVCHTTIVQDAWKRKDTLSVHGWIYSLGDGLLQDLNLCVSEVGQLPPAYHMDEIG